MWLVFCLFLFALSADGGFFDVLVYLSHLQYPPNAIHPATPSRNGGGRGGRTEEVSHEKTKSVKWEDMRAV